MNIFQMVELHSFKDCDFTLANGDDCDNKLINETDTEVEDSEEEVSNEMLSNDLKHCQQQLFRFLNAMKNQKENLQNTLNLLKRFSNGKLFRNVIDFTKNIFLMFPVLR